MCSNSTLEPYNLNFSAQNYFHKGHSGSPNDGVLRSKVTFQSIPVSSLTLVPSATIWSFVKTIEWPLPCTTYTESLGPYTVECFLGYSLILLFFCTFLHSPFPILKCCIQLAKPGKLPLVSVNQEKNSGTHILMITELGKKHCFLHITISFCSVVGVSNSHLLVFDFTGCNKKGYPHGTALNV